MAAYVKVHQIGDYSLLRFGDTFFVSVYDAETKKVRRQSLRTNDFATAVDAVQSLAERRIDARVGGVR